jgi:lipoprotein-anchoring transpeptidase ErfK/SrfK
VRTVLGASLALVLAAPPAPAAAQQDAPVVLVSVAERMLWLVEGGDTVLATPVAVGSGDTLSHGRRRWTFRTPRGERRVLRKEANPVWVPPLWHFVERARETGRPLVELRPGRAHRFPDGSRVEVRDGLVGHRLANGAWIPWEPGQEVVVNGILFVPPLGTRNRRVAGELGEYKLDLGDGYLLHGTPHTESIGTAATHGCIRVPDEALRTLWQRVPVGARVLIR